MRSVQLFPMLGIDALVELLDGLGRRSGSEWFGIAGGGVEVGVTAHGSVEAMLATLDRQGYESAAEGLRAAGGALSGLWVEVRISGRRDLRELQDLQAQVVDIAGHILAGGGYGMNDYSDGVWSLDDIRRGRADGIRFFA